MLLFLFAAPGVVPSEVAAGHLALHPGSLAIPTPSTVTGAHLALTGGTLRLPVPSTLTASHLSLHPGTLTIQAIVPAHLRAHGGVMYTMLQPLPDDPDNLAPAGTARYPLL